VTLELSRRASEDFYGNSGTLQYRLVVRKLVASPEAGAGSERFQLTSTTDRVLDHPPPAMGHPVVLHFIYIDGMVAPVSSYLDPMYEYELELHQCLVINGTIRIVCTSRTYSVKIKAETTVGLIEGEVENDGVSEPRLALNYRSSIPDALKREGWRRQRSGAHVFQSDNSLTLWAPPFEVADVKSVEGGLLITISGDPQFRYAVASRCTWDPDTHTLSCAGPTTILNLA
jgi:hypothetical protein